MNKHLINPILTQHHIYREFFLSHDLVISSHLVHQLMPHFSNIADGGVAITKALGKAYLGISLRSKKISLHTNAIYYSTSDGEFKELDIGIYNPNYTQLTSYVDNLFEHENEKISWSILFERYPNEGYGGLAVECALLSLGIKLRKGEITQNDFETSDFAAVEHIVKFAIELYKVANPNSSYGTFIYPALTNKQGLYRFDTGIFDHIEMSAEFPVDYTIVSSGASFSRDTSRKKFEHTIEQNVKEVTETQSKIGITELKSSWLKIIQMQKLKSLKRLENLAQYPYDSTLMHQYIRSCQERGNLIDYFDGENELINAIHFYFEGSKSFSQEICAMYPLSSGMAGGSIQITTPRHLSRPTILQVLDQLKNNNFPKLQVTHHNRDTNNNLKPALEQYISNNIFSEYIDQNTCILRGIDGSVSIDTAAHLLEQHAKWLLFDSTSNSIWFEGEKVSEGVIKSKIYTNSILEMLVLHLDQPIKSSQLPIGSYSQAKNQFTSKIISPLQELCEQYLGQKIPLKVSGELYNFEVMLEKSGLRVGVLTRM